ncbi:MAG: helix-turn-helix domain-containing protein [Proteobacteria bacterium]|nr:helix-turn-helix domain-containing protein [Pseudomonadota bacterium]
MTDQFDAWRSWYGTIFDSNPRLPTRDGFRASASTWILGGFTFSQVSTPAVDGHRTKAHIRRNPVDHWVLTSYRRGQSTVGLDRASLEPLLGTPFVVSLGEEVKIERRNESDRVALHLSRDRFQSVAAILDAARGHSLDAPQGRLLADYMLLLERNLPDLEPEMAGRLGDAVRGMIEACLAPSRDRVVDAGSQIKATLMERVRRAVTKHLRSPSLGPVQLCREAATSRSQLYRLLEHEGGVARYIQRRRLLEAWTMLCDAASSQSIAAIAEMLCFSDASSFSRAFRREFGMTPGDVRAAGRCGLHFTSSTGEGDHDVSSFADCLRMS